MAKTLQEILNTTDDEAHRHWVRFEATRESLDEYILKTSNNEGKHRIGLAERERRQFEQLHKPHWSLPWTFWVTVAVLIVAILAWLFPRTVEKETSPLGQGAYSNPATLFYTATPQTNATQPQPKSPIAPQTSPPAIYAMPSTNH